MESSLKNLLFRARSKSRHTPRTQPTQDSFPQTSGYETVTPGPAPKRGTIPIKPSQDKQPRKSLGHTKTGSDGLQEFRRGMESANVGRPRTAPGVKPYFVGISRPGTSDSANDARSRGPSIDVVVSKDFALSDAPPVPPIPKDADKLRPRYLDILHFATQQQSSRINYNEHIAARNMDIPGKRVDRFEEEVATRNASFADAQRASFDKMRASQGAMRPTIRYSRTNSSEKAAQVLGLPVHMRLDAPSDRNPRRVANSDAANGHKNSVGGSISNARTATSVPQGAPTLESPVGGSTSGSSAGAVVATTRSGRSSAQHSRQNSRDRVIQLPSIPQARTAAFSQDSLLTDSKPSNDEPVRSRAQTPVNEFQPHRTSLPSRPTTIRSTSEDARDFASQLPRTSRNGHSRHNSYRSMVSAESAPENSMSLESFNESGLNQPFAENRANHERSSSRASQNKGYGRHSERPQMYSTGSARSSTRSSLAMSTASSTVRRMEAFGRTVMDLTNDNHPTSSQQLHHDLHAEQREEDMTREEEIRDWQNSSRSPKANIFRDNISVSFGKSQVPLTAKDTLPQLSAIEGDYAGPDVQKGSNSSKPISTALPESMPVTPANSEVYQKPVRRTSFRSQVTGGGSAPNIRTIPKGRVAFEVPETPSAGQDGYIYGTPESLESTGFVDPSRAFGVNARDFAVSPSDQARGQLQSSATSHPNPAVARSIPMSPPKNEVQHGKSLHHISHVTLPAKHPLIKNANQSPKRFDEEHFASRQAQARAALLRLEKSLQEDFSFPLASFASVPIKGPVHFHDLSIEDGAPVAPISRFAKYHSPNNAYQNDHEGENQSRTEEIILVATGGSHSKAISVSAANAAPAPNVEFTSRGRNRNSLISTISEVEGEEEPWDSAPYPTVPFSTSPDRGRSTTSNRPSNSRMHSTTSNGSRSSAFSVPEHMVPERTSSLRDNEVPTFHIDDAGWE